MGGLTNPLLPLTELRLRDVQAMLPPRVLRQLRRVMLCGNYGDPIMAKDCKEILNWMRRESPETRLSMHTNGGARAASWWRSLGSVMSGRNYVRFGIDGLEDTNHLYRQHVNWRTLMRNAQAFIAGGGNAQWDYLVFAHNEHQVEAARDLAVALGFSEFSPKKTQRFLNKATGIVRPTYGVKDRSGAVVRDLEPPRAAEWVNAEVEHTWRQLLSSYGSQEAVHAASVVHCKTGRDGDRSVYLAADGLVWPCCWLAQQMYLLRPIIILTADPFCIGILYFLNADQGSDFAALRYNDNMAPDERQVVRLAEQLPGGLASLDARRRPIDEIAEGPLFRVVAASWLRPTVEAGKLKPCASICGAHCDAFGAQRPAPQVLARRPPRAETPATAGMRTAARQLGTWKHRAEKGLQHNRQRPTTLASSSECAPRDSSINSETDDTIRWRVGVLLGLLVVVQGLEWLGLIS